MKLFHKIPLFFKRWLPFSVTSMEKFFVSWVNFHFLLFALVILMLVVNLAIIVPSGAKPSHCFSSTCPGVQLRFLAKAVRSD